MKTKSISLSSLGVGILVAASLIALTLVAYVSADTRGTRDRSGEEETTPPADPTPPTNPPSNDGNIDSSTSGSADTGGNSGGNVETGDESVTVNDINIGPTNDVDPSDWEDTSDDGDEEEDGGSSDSPRGETRQR